MHKVLILLLSSGENELEDCKLSIKNQKNVDFDIFHIKDLPNKEAHLKLYKTIEENIDYYSIFVKVDADMVFLDDYKLYEIIKCFTKDDELDHIAFSVFDWYSQKAIIGMNAFSNRCFWPKFDDLLFVDPLPCYPGKSKIVWNSPAPVALHSPNPSIIESIQFGFHRGKKIVQYDRRIPVINRSNFQYNLMYQVYAQMLLDSDERRLAVLYGLKYAISNKRDKVLHAKNAPLFYELLDDFNKLNKLNLKAEIIKDWTGPYRSSFFSFLKFKVWLRYIFWGFVRKSLKRFNI
jgi:hypothetical protein